MKVVLAYLGLGVKDQGQAKCYLTNLDTAHWDITLPLWAAMDPFS